MDRFKVSLAMYGDLLLRLDGKTYSELKPLIFSSFSHSNTLGENGISYLYTFSWFFVLADAKLYFLNRIHPMELEAAHFYELKDNSFPSYVFPELSLARASTFLKLDLTFSTSCIHQ